MTHVTSAPAAAKPVARAAADAALRAPAVLLPYQQRWCADTAPVKICEKSRRIGLSWAEAADSALMAASDAGMDTWYVGYNKDMAQEFILDCADWARSYGMVAGEIEETEEVFVEGDERKAILAFVIRFASGFRITALSSRPSNLLGKQGRVIIDEAAFHDQLGELLKAAMALLIWGGQVHIISTHDGADNPFAELIEECRAGKKPYSVHRIPFVQALAEGLYQRVCLKKGIPWTIEGERAWAKEIRDFYGEDAEEELDCVPKRGGGKYLSIALIESRMSADTTILEISRNDEFVVLPEHIRMADIADWCNAQLLPLLAKIPSTVRSYYGQDFGRSGDLSSGVPLIQANDLVRRLPFLLEMANIPFECQKQLVFFLLDRLPNLMGAAFDATGNGAYLAEVAMQRYGRNRVDEIKLSQDWYMRWMPKLKAGLEDGNLDGLPKHDGVRDDLRGIEKVKGIPMVVRRTAGKDKQQRHGDSAVALCLANYASYELNKGPVRVTSRPRRGGDIARGY